jgi:aromatic-amino-acid transaminase
VKKLVFGADSEPYRSGRVATVQGLGGTGALKIGADFLKHLNPNAKVLISDPSWENHRALFTQAGFPVGTYRYYDAATRQLDCRHAGRPEGRRSRHHRGAACLLPQPHGYDISAAQWDQVIAAVKARGLTPFLDMAWALPRASPRTAP